MYRHQETSKSQVSNPVASAPTTRLPHRWLFLTRSVCALLILLALSIFIATLPVYYTLLQTVCTVTAQCAVNQLSTHAISVIHSLGLSLHVYATIEVGFKAISVLIYVVVAVMLFWLKSDDWLALLVALMLVAVGTGNAATDLPVLTHLFSPSLALVISSCSNFLSTLSFFLVFSLFPDGWFVPRWTRWVVAALFIGSILEAFPSLSSTSIVTLLWNVLWAVGAIMLVIAQIYRYRHVSSPKQRQQTKWIVFSLAILFIIGFLIVGPILVFPSLGQSDSLYQLFSGFIGNYLVASLIPVSFAIALLRYRLWDVDILINRALVYGSLTALLALLYFGLILALQSLVNALIGHGSQSPLVIVASTLIIAALFHPLRRRLQALIDRRFYRKKYDAARILSAFSATLRNELDLTQLSEQLLQVVQETMQPAHVSLWLRKTESESNPTPNEKFSALSPVEKEMF